jgi:tetratricopeptide (TPR) repeat protein
MPVILFVAMVSSPVVGDQKISNLLARGDSLAKAANFDSAIVVELRALALAEEQYGPVDSTVAIALVKLGIAHFYKAQYEESRKLWNRALAIREEVLGPDHPETANSMMYIGILHDQLGSPSQAVPVFEKALAVFDRAENPPPAKVADCILNLAISHLKLGQLELAKTNFEKALVLYEEAQGPYGDGVGGCISNLALIYHETGDYAKALSMYQRAVTIMSETQGENHPDVALAIENIANTYVALGQYDEAEQYYKRAIKIKKATLGPAHPEVANTMMNLGNLYQTQRAYTQAEPLLLDALEIMEKTYGPDHPDLAYILANLARVYTQTDRQEEAERCFRRTIEIREKSLGSFHPKVATTLNNLGVLYVEQGRNHEALQCYSRALDINEKVLGPDHPAVAGVLENTATVYRHEGKADSAFALYNRACEIYQENLIRNGRALTERDALSYSRELANAISRYLSAFLEFHPADSQVEKNVVNVILRGKGQVSDVMFERTKIIVMEPDADVRALADSLQRHRKQLSDMFIQGPGSSISKYRSEIKTLTDLINTEEMKLAEKSASFRKWRAAKAVTSERVLEQLPANTSLVEYLQYQRAEFDPDTITPAYAAIVIGKNADPVIVDLGDAVVIDDLVGSYRRHFKQVASLGAPSHADVAEYRSIARDIYAKIWLPVVDYVSGNDLVFVCPDAALNLVSFAGLPVAPNDYLIERHALHYLSSGRDLLRGDPDYDLSQTSGNTVNQAAEPAATRGALPDCDDFRNTLVNPLPGTRREVEQIVAAWAELESEPTTVFLGAEATEDAFKKNAEAKRVIHLATHGYYVSGQCGSDPTDDIGAAEVPMPNPLLLSGLFLAGANRRGEIATKDNGEDGVLTAFEVSSLDLTGCNLVVLSACETGLGEPEAGEGVYGLRRAFHTAGARSVVSALWEVSDQDAARFAAPLYTRDDRTLPYRLRDLQIEIIGSLRGRRLPDHPFSWAAFIAQGDSRF